MSEEEAIWDAAKRYFPGRATVTDAEYLCQIIWDALDAVQVEEAEQDYG